VLNLKRRSLNFSLFYFLFFCRLFLLEIFDVVVHLAQLYLQLFNSNFHTFRFWLKFVYIFLNCLYLLFLLVILLGIIIVHPVILVLKNFQSLVLHFYTL